MKITYKDNVYDFNGKRVKKNGKCMTKFDLAWEFDRVIKYSYLTVIYDVISYEALKEDFKKGLIQKVKKVGF